MSEVATSEPVVTEPVAVVKKPRNKSVPTDEKVVKQIYDGLTAGQSDEEIAASLNMNVGAFRSKLNTVRKLFKTAKEQDPTFVNPFEGIERKRGGGGGRKLDVLNLLKGFVKEIEPQA